MRKIVCFSGVEAPGGVVRVPGADLPTARVPEHRVYWAIVDGELRQVRVLPGLDLLRDPGYAVWPGPYACEFDENGYITRVGYAEEFITGYSINAPKGGKIILGVEDAEYRFVPGAPVYSVANPEIIKNFKTSIDELETDWNDNWFIRLNGDGAICEMYIFRQAGDGASPLLAEIKKFRTAWGPADPATGLAIEYNYFQPPARAGAKYPVFVWLHGLHGGTSAWTNQFEYNPIANWAGEGFQKLFAQGGAYIITPRANEDLRPGHGISWNRLQTAPLFAALEDFVKTHPDADARRIYVGGYSMGGGMTWLLIRERPDFFAAAVPCCPRLDYAADDFSDQEALNSALAPLAGLPIWEIHGEGDSVTPPEQSGPLRRALLSNAAAANTDTRFLTLPTGYLFPDGKTPTPVDHLVWIPALNNLLFDDGSPYRDVSGAAAESTLIEWLNACPDSPEKL